MANIKITGTVMKCESRFTPQGKQVLEIGLSLYTGGDREKGYNKSVWVNCAAWEELAVANDALKKGDRITVTGQVKEPRTYKKDGIDYPAGLEVTAYEIEVGDTFKPAE
ncbi:MAG: single-stranded DNA-binding protein [Candidatus Paceibacterota bacterium]